MRAERLRLRLDAQIARDHARVREQRGVTNERLNEPGATYESIRKPGAASGSVSAKVAADLVDRCRTSGERRAAAILGAELWRKQVTKVVLSIADKVEGIVTMAGAELAELGQKLEALTMRVRRLELSERAAEAQRERDAKRKRTLASKRRKARNRARKAKS